MEVRMTRKPVTLQESSEPESLGEISRKLLCPSCGYSIGYQREDRPGRVNYQKIVRKESFLKRLLRLFR